MINQTFIEGKCHSNLDEFSNMSGWPKVFATVPEIGSRVQNKSGHMLKVVGITHTTRARLNEFNSRDEDSPFILVELHR